MSMGVNIGFGPEDEAPGRDGPTHKVLWIADLGGQAAHRGPHEVDKADFAELMKKQRLEVEIQVDNQLGDGGPARLPVRLRFETIKDFSPDAIVRQVPALEAQVTLRDDVRAGRVAVEARPPPEPEPAAAARSEPVPDGASLLDALLDDAPAAAPTPAGNPVDAFVKSVVKKGSKKKRDPKAIAARVAEIDAALSATVSAILHHPEVQRLESAWRSLRGLVKAFDFRENVRLDVLDVGKAALAADVAGLAGVVARHETPSNDAAYSMIVAHFEFDTSDADMALLEALAKVGADNQVPVVTNAGPGLFGVEDFDDLAETRSLEDKWAEGAHEAWKAFRGHEAARYVLLCLPRVLLREPYGEAGLSTKAFAFEEDVVGHSARYLWGLASSVFAEQVAERFATSRQRPSIPGGSTQSEAVQLPLHQYEQDGEHVTRPPTAVRIDIPLEGMLGRAGLMGLVWEGRTNQAAFLGVTSAHAG